MKKEELIIQLARKKDQHEILSISDLQEKEFEGEHLLEEEQEALREFRQLRLKKLKESSKSEKKFHKKFEYLRTLSLLLDYRDLLANKAKLF